MIALLVEADGAVRRVRGNASTNAAENFYSIVKRGLNGVYQHWGRQHVGRYMHEFDFRFSHRHISDTERTDLALAGIEGKRLQYR